MENRHLIFAPAHEWLEFLYGGAPERAKSPAAIAWALEHDAVEQGWPRDGFMGSERGLMRRFGVSRAMIRQAVRIVESHGSMVMKRGRSGGLHLTCASVELTAVSLAIYLCACGGTVAELDAIASVADPLFAELAAPNLVEQVYKRTLELFYAGTAKRQASEARAAVIALRLLTHGTTLGEPIPERGRPLGSEAALCERFNGSRNTLRQALRLIDDLGMLQVKRGRGGGYLLKRPSPIGMMRHTFTLFASHHQTLDQLVPMTWQLNLISLRLCAQKLQRLDTSARAAQRAELEALLADLPEPARWIALQQAIERGADAQLIGTLQRAIVAYQGRLRVQRLSEFSPITQPLGALEDQIVTALCDGDLHAAESHQRAAQQLISQLLLRSGSNG